MQNNCIENSKEIQKHQCDLCIFVTPIWIWTWQTFSGITHPKHVPSMLTVRISISTFLLFTYLQLQIKTTPMLHHLQTVRKAADSHPFANCCLRRWKLTSCVASLQFLEVLKKMPAAIFKKFVLFCCSTNRCVINQDKRRQWNWSKATL